MEEKYKCPSCESTELEATFIKVLNKPNIPAIKCSKCAWIGKAEECKVKERPPVPDKITWNTANSGAAIPDPFVDTVNALIDCILDLRGEE